MFVCMNRFSNIRVSLILCEVAATINQRGDEPYLFPPCWLQPPAVASNSQCDQNVQPSGQECHHPITMTETTHQ
jgi:hypothetical protein